MGGRANRYDFPESAGFSNDRQVRLSPRMCADSATRLHHLYDSLSIASCLSSINFIVLVDPAPVMTRSPRRHDAKWIQCTAGI
jgi:hypothetical protein